MNVGLFKLKTNLMAKARHWGTLSQRCTGIPTCCTYENARKCELLENTASIRRASKTWDKDYIKNRKYVNITHNYKFQYFWLKFRLVGREQALSFFIIREMIST